MQHHPKWQRPIAVVALAFGVLTLVSGGSAIFGGLAAKAAVGDAVPFVLWFNFFAGFAYIYGAAALWTFSPNAKRIALFIGLATLAIFGLLLVKIMGGTPFEGRTIGAMTLRAGVWLAISLALPKTI